MNSFNNKRRTVPVDSLTDAELETGKKDRNKPI